MGGKKVTCKPIEQFEIPCEHSSMEGDEAHVGGHKCGEESGGACSAGKRMPEGEQGAAKSPPEVQHLAHRPGFRFQDGEGFSSRKPS